MKDEKPLSLDRQAGECAMREVGHFEKAIFNLNQHLSNETIRQSLVDASIDPASLENWINEWKSLEKLQLLRRLARERLYTLFLHSPLNQESEPPSNE